MKPKILWTVLGFSLLPLWHSTAQERESFEQYKAKRKSDFNNYKEKRRKEFEEYRRKRNEEFAAYLRKKWKDVAPSPVLPRPKDENIAPVVTPQEKTKPLEFPRELPYDEIVHVPIPKPQPAPIHPIDEIPITPHTITPTEQTKTFTFFGTSEKVRYNEKSAIRLNTLDESAIAEAWLELSEETYTNLIHDCLKIRKTKHLCDWAYLVMLQQMAESIYGKSTNESVLLMAYIYCQSGYKMRLAINGNRLFMMFASEHTIYDWNYYILDGERYYTYGNQTGNVRICEQKYPQERAMSLLITQEQLFSMAQAPSHTHHQSAKDPNIQLRISANKNALDFYTSFPTSMYGDNFVTRWAIYANTPMPQHIKKQIYPSLRQAIKDCDQWTAVNKLLNFIQTGFVYEYDDKVWGNDRAFFPEESLFYPYCDCEDRSILLTRLIRDLLGLKCILVFYPGHLAAAIAFTQGTPSGDYIGYQGQKFFIADGTILYGAPIGQTMNKVDNQTAKIILLE